MLAVFMIIDGLFLGKIGEVHAGIVVVFAIKTFLGV
jgi:hypothetical protein